MENKKRTMMLAVLFLLGGACGLEAGNPWNAFAAGVGIPALEPAESVEWCDDLPEVEAAPPRDRSASWRLPKISRGQAQLLAFALLACGTTAIQLVSEELAALETLKLEQESMCPSSNLLRENLLAHQEDGFARCSTSCWLASEMLPFAFKRDYGGSMEACFSRCFQDFALDLLQCAVPGT